jgi:hypothetical protein
VKVSLAQHSEPPQHLTDELQQNPPQQVWELEQPAEHFLTGVSAAEHAIVVLDLMCLLVLKGI